MDARTLLAVLLGGVVALLGSVVTAVVSARIQERGRTSHRRAGAYSSLLAAAGVISLAAASLRLNLQTRTGLGAALEIALYYRKPLDPAELFDRLRIDTAPLYAAWSDVWTVGSQDAIEAANTLVNSTSELMAAAVRQSSKRSWLARLLLPLRWTAEEEAEYREAMKKVAQARRTLALVARREAGVPIAEVFTQTDS